MNNIETISREVTPSMLADAIINKSKRGFRRYKTEVGSQAMLVMGEYRNLVYKVVTNNSLSISQESHKGHLESLDFTKRDKLSKKKKNRVVVDIRDKDTFLHEIGHAVDLWFNKSLTSNVILSNSKTLKEIFIEELNAKHHEIYLAVKEDYQKIVDATIFEGAFDILTSHMDKYRELKLEKDVSKRKELLDFLYKSRFMEVYYQLTMKSCHKRINEKYSFILDALSSLYPLDNFHLICHDFTYYQRDDSLGVEEFFAHAFRLKVMGRLYKNMYIHKLMPQTFRYFNELFDIFKDHILNDKRFNDVKLKGE